MLGWEKESDSRSSSSAWLNEEYQSFMIFIYWVGMYMNCWEREGTLSYDISV